MVELYADLVEYGLRTLDPEEGKIQVPSFLHDKVKVELDRRKSLAQ